MILTGLDGANPLGFLAAVGLLRWCTEEAGYDARLGWIYDGVYRPVLEGAPDVQQLAQALEGDARLWLHRSPLGLAYGKKGAVARDLKPPPEEFTRWVDALRQAGDRRGLAFAMGYASEIALDNNGAIKPTALHFTAGRQEFLASVLEIADQVTVDDFVEALTGPWSYSRQVKSLSWDATQSRDYALRASDPSRESRAGVPGADWLAFQALPLFPVIAIRDGADGMRRRGVEVRVASVAAVERTRDARLGPELAGARGTRTAGRRRATRLWNPRGTRVRCASLRPGRLRLFRSGQSRHAWGSVFAEPTDPVGMKAAVTPLSRIPWPIGLGYGSYFGLGWFEVDHGP